MISSAHDYSIPPHAILSSQSNTNTIHVLHLEDNPLDAQLIKDYLNTTSVVAQITLVASQQQYQQCLHAHNYDFIFADYTLPDFDALQALHVLKMVSPQTPFILVSGTIDEELAIDCLKAGATDYVLKNRLSRLYPVIQRTLQEKEAHQKKQQAEAARVAEKAFFQTLIEHSSDLITLIDAEMVITYQSPTIQPLFGYPVNALLHTSILDYIHPEDVFFVEEVLKSVAESALDFLLEFRFRAKDGSWRYLETNVSNRLQQPNVYAFVLNSRDISVRKQTDAVLKESEERYRTLIESSHDLIQSISPEGKVLFVNKAWQETLGYSLDELCQLSMFDIIAPVSLTYCQQHFMEVMQGKKIDKLQATFKAKNGTEIIVEGSAAPRLVNGEVIAAQSFFRDITQRKKAEEALQQLNEDLEKRVTERTLALKYANQTLEAFNATVSHDLRAPLRNIKLFAQLLGRKCSTNIDTETNEYVDFIVGGVQKMEHLIAQLLAFAKLGKQAKQLRWVKMQLLVEAVFQELLYSTQRENVHFHIKNTLPKVWVDAAMIRQLWFNLLSNALKYSSKRVESRIEVGSYQENQQIIFYVKDNGAGFDMTYAHQLFHMFKRLHTDHEFEGTGVGLSIVAQIIQYHNGQVWAEGEVDEGATFYFSLPQKEES